MVQHSTDPDGHTTEAIVRGSNQTGMRAYNERLVLTILRAAGPESKAELARMTGLSAQTVSVIMRKLESEGLIERCAPLRGKVGQPSVPMRLAPRGAISFGLKVGRRSVEMVMIDFLGQILGRVHRIHAYPTPDATVAFAEDALQRLLASLDPPLRARAAGLGIAMPFNLWSWARAIGVPEDAMASWRDSDVRSEIAARCDLPVFLQNDASSACGAELIFGSGRKPRDFLYFYIGFFVGGGVVLNGSLYTGPTGNAGAVGSMLVPDGTGGFAQLIDVASLSGLEKAMLRAGMSTNALWQSPDGWEADNPAVSRWLDDAAVGLAHATVAAASVIDFDTALIDGWLPIAVRARLIERAQEVLARLDTSGLAPPELRAGTLGPEARALGAASLPLSERFLVDQNALLKAS